MAIKTPQHDRLFEQLDEFYTLYFFTDFLIEKNVPIDPDDILRFLGIDPDLLDQEVKFFQRLESSIPTIYPL